MAYKVMACIAMVAAAVISRARCADRRLLLTVRVSVRSISVAPRSIG